MPTTSTLMRLLSTRQVRHRYGDVCARTINRWRKQGILPDPDVVINNRNYWRDSTLDEHDRRSMAEASEPRHA
jgi:hypothetical protein